MWDLYVIDNEKGKTIHEIWDGSQVKCSFRSSFSEEMMLRWYELENAIQHIILTGENHALTEENHALLWQYESNGVYSSKSLHA